MATTTIANAAPAAAPAPVQDLSDKAAAISANSVQPTNANGDSGIKVKRVQPIDTVRLSDAVQSRILHRQGETITQIAGSLGISPKTVAFYVADAAANIASDAEKLARVQKSKRV